MYAAPAPTGGLAPVSVSCSPASGASFPLGTTVVTCNGADAATPPRTATTSFAVTLVAFVPPVPALRATRFMAFGDSITAGEINDDTAPCVRPQDRTPAAIRRDLGTPFLVQPDLAYPQDLQRLLATRYTGQTFIAFNEGNPAESTTAGIPRFAAVVRADRPEAVLLMQGIIDIADAGFSAGPTIVSSLDTDIVEARRQGVGSVFLSTLVPVREGVFRGCYATNAQIEAANAQIRSLAARDNAFLVDSYAAFAGHESTLIGPDGLHPTVEGQQVIANTFFDVIRSKLEVVSGASQIFRARR
jgi:lysophospholipase L1-like esterase